MRGVEPVFHAYGLLRPLRTSPGCLRAPGGIIAVRQLLGCAGRVRAVPSALPDNAVFRRESFTTTPLASPRLATDPLRLSAEASRPMVDGSDARCREPSLPRAFQARGAQTLQERLEDDSPE